MVYVCSHYLSLYTLSHMCMHSHVHIIDVNKSKHLFTSMVHIMCYITLYLNIDKELFN